MDSKIRIMVADPQELFRKSLSLLLKLQDDFHICGEAANGRELIDKIKMGSFHIVLLDVNMPYLDGRTALSIISSRFPEVKVMILTSQYETLLMSEFMANGASCYLSKMCEVKTLVQAIRTVHSEGYYFDKATSEAMLYGLVNKTRQVGKDESFTGKEMEVIRKICDGLTNKEIAQSLSIASSTVDFYKSKIYSKTNCSNASQLVRYSIIKGLVSIN